MKTRSKATKTHPGVRGTTASQSNTPTRPSAPVALLKMFGGSAKTITGVKKEEEMSREPICKACLALDQVRSVKGQSDTCTSKG